jgi:hypothetical protein
MIVILIMEVKNVSFGFKEQGHYRCPKEVGFYLI